MRVPELVYADDFKDNVPSVLINGYYMVAKPLGFQGFQFRKRFLLAYKVLIGEMDAVRYSEDIEKDKK